jgi:CheY-like chemotaxis protein
MENVVPIDILIVEDNPSDVRLIKELLSDYRLTNNIIWATNGEDALKIIRERKPHLAILDMFLSKLTGDIILKEVRADRSLDEVKVVVMSASVSDIEIVKQKCPLADGFMTKPITLEGLASIVSQIDHLAVSIVLVTKKN